MSKITDRFKPDRLTLSDPSEYHRDFRKLCKIAQLSDMTPLIPDMLEVMYHPTQAKRAFAFSHAIRLWIAEHGEKHATNPFVHAIKLGMGMP